MLRGGREIARQIRQRIGLGPGLDLSERLAKMERVFLAPPLTLELAASIRLISPHFRASTSDKNRLAWEADQNTACWDEYEVLAPLFAAMPRPGKILEIGCGMGRSLVFFSKKLKWEHCVIDAYEGDGSKTKYTILGPRFEDSYCGNIKMLEYVLDYNGIENVTVFNASDVRLAALPGPYDFLYSFYSIGFHWGLDHFLDDLLPLMHDDSVAVFTVPPGFLAFARLEALAYRLLDWPRGEDSKLLVLGKNKLPEF